ncbi:hypothetical protein [Mangrovibacterium diazotrophicum]|uniref:Uncharacterized protein n=1 Tax=Mangrovibacterium diazotrophicum TaxID=1261403 RepID=A0A419VXK3_9BACT|nr:hypothetical protein [Mangrovibacterium diazotrophicum]RKD87810.1 hypothetical protein BC643_3817 [Mangrovibacterium diazotrophicum]
MKNLTLALMLFLNVSFVTFSQSISNRPISPDSIAQKTFSEGQLMGIADMIAYVDEFVCAKTGEQDVVLAYSEFFQGWQNTMTSAGSSVEIYTDYCIPFNSKMDFLGALDSITFEAFFYLDDYINGLRWNDTLLVDINLAHVELRSIGLFSIYMKRLGEGDWRFNQLYEAVDAVGDFPPSIISIFNIPKNNFDFSQYKDRLLAVVVILTSTTVKQLYDAYMEKESHQ